MEKPVGLDIDRPRLVQLTSDVEDDNDVIIGVVVGGVDVLNVVAL